ncbi:MAG: DUF5777 family beta-barrel protein [bacterium]
MRIWTVCASVCFACSILAGPMARARPAEAAPPRELSREPAATPGTTRPTAAARPAPAAKPPPKRTSPQRAAPARRPPRRAVPKRARPGPRAAQDDDDFEGVKVEVIRKPKVVKRSGWHADTWTNPDAWPKLERVVTHKLARTTRRLGLLIIVDHRTNQPAFTKNILKDFFGLDGGGLKIGLGLRFGIFDDLDIGFLRLNGVAEIFDVYEFDVRYHFLRQEKHHLDMGLVVGGTWFEQRNAKDAGGAYGQLIFHRTFFRRLLVGASLLFHSDSSLDTKKKSDTQWSFAIGTFLHLRIHRAVAWTFEMMNAVAGFRAEHPAWSSSVQFLTQRHTFSLVLTSTNYFSSDGMVSNTWRSWKELVIGFSITREILF